MICDLLARAGISARVDGEFLAGAGGELPLGSTISVRVDPSRAAEAREVIDEWQKLQPLDPTPATARAPLRGPLWFFIGAVCGAWFAYLGLKTPVTKVEIYDESETRIVARQNFADGRLVSIDLDHDGDGDFERHVEIDRFGLPK